MTRKEKDGLEHLKTDQQFLTFDLGLSSSLKSLKFELWGLNKDNPNKVQFIFKKSEGIDEAIQDYWNDSLPINARTLFDCQKLLKNRIYSD